MKEHGYLMLDDPQPDFETEVAEWWLCEKREKYAVWRVRRRDGFYETYALQRLKDHEIVKESQKLDEIGLFLECFEQFY